MKLGLLVTTDRFPGLARGIAEAAVAKGHEVVLFATDEGTRLLRDPGYAALAAVAGVSMAFCDHSMQRHGGRPPGLPAAVRSGSQFDNAVMFDDADKVIVL
jgi:predicted peroxiredoxin